VRPDDTLRLIGLLPGGEAGARAGGGVAESVSFATGIAADLQAVRAALQFKWSNGQTEGQVHRLKLVKSQMYGRGKPDLLRARVLYAA
jgi:transposase